MNIVFSGNDAQLRELQEGCPAVTFLVANTFEEAILLPGSDALIFTGDLKALSAAALRAFVKPVFIAAVEHTISEQEWPQNVMRINAWSGFLAHRKWEVSGRQNDAAEVIFATLGKIPMYLPDDPGFITPRILSMIINEAWFALGENVSTREPIDTALKLGTNYPFGPFEWQDKIGALPVYSLLAKLSITNERYKPAPAFTSYITNLYGDYFKH